MLRPFQLSAFSLQLSRLAACLIFLASAAAASAFLGDTEADITKHRGKPSGHPEKNKAIWLFEGNDGQLAYAVRFDANGRSIAETLKPAQVGRSLHREIVADFIKAQTTPFKDSPTLLEPKPGEKYLFANQTLTVAENEYVVVDAPSGLLIVWVRGSLPSVTAITPAALQ